MGQSQRPGRVYRGFLLGRPVVGRGLVIYRDPTGRRMITSAVRRVLTTEDENVLYIETDNSVYKLTLNPAEQQESPRATGA